jgi:CDP-paratose 2-epimerase
MKTILITGGAGFIGSNSAIFFSKKKFKILIFDNLSREGTKKNLDYLKKNIKLNFFLGDICEFEKISYIIKKYKPDYVLHLAGQVAVTRSIDNPIIDFNVNIKGTINILEAIRVFSKKTKLIYSSTNKVYGELTNQSILKNKKRYYFKNLKNGVNESQSLDFHSPYGCSKGSADQYVFDYSRIYNLNTFCFRQSCIYGRNQYGLEDQGWISWIISRALLDKKIKIFGDGKQVRDILFIDDLVKLYYLCFTSNNFKYRVFNVGGGFKNSISLIELLDILEKKLNRKLNKEFLPWRPGDQKVYISDIRLTTNVFKWKILNDKNMGISKIFEWIVKNVKHFND